MAAAAIAACSGVPLEMQGGTTFHFVTEGIHAALERASDAAGGKDIKLAGGAEVIQRTPVQVPLSS